MAVHLPRVAALPAFPDYVLHALAVVHDEAPARPERGRQRDRVAAAEVPLGDQLKLPDEPDFGVSIVLPQGAPIEGDAAVPDGQVAGVPIILHDRSDVAARHLGQPPGSWAAARPFSGWRVPTIPTGERFFIFTKKRVFAKMRAR